jgi:protein TonB
MNLSLPRQERVLGAALGLSLALHVGLLSMHFRSPEGSRSKPESPPLEVVLVNARSKERPVRAEVLAQSNLDRGGTVEQNRRAKTPLPVTEPRKPGKDLADAQRRQRALEARQQELLAQARAAQSAVPTAPPKEQGVEERGAQPSGRDLADLTLAAMRLQAQIDRQIEQYQKRPRKQFIGANAGEYRFAQYEEDWRIKIERVGTLNYPPEARGKLYGNLRLTVTIRADGSVESIELDRSSGLKVLDAAAFKIVRMATPFAAFPPDIRRDTDLLVITRTWFFGQGDKIWTE